MVSNAIDINEAEIIVFIFMGFILVYYSINRKRIAKFIQVRPLDYALNFMFISKVCTILEGILWGELFNIIEHLTILITTICVAWWIIDMKKDFDKKRGAPDHA